MGQNFNQVLIKRNPNKKKEDVLIVIQENLLNIFEKEEDGLTYLEFYKKKWNDRSRIIIGLWFGENAIIIDDEYERINNNFIENLSIELDCEIIKVTNSDTVSFSEVSFYKQGKLRRKKSYGLEEFPDYVQKEEKPITIEKSKPSLYEVNGSDAVSVRDQFYEMNLREEDMNSIISYREKRENSA